MRTIKRLTVYLAASMPAELSYVEAVASVGKYLAEHDITLIFGGSREGTMKVLADSVLKHGGKAIGIFTQELPISILHPGLTESYIAKNMAERKAMMLDMSDALIALPGSYGTLDELFDALALAKVNRLFHGESKPIGLLNVNGFYDHLVAFLRHTEELGITPSKCKGLLKFGDSMESLMAQLREN